MEAESERDDRCRAAGLEGGATSQGMQAASRSRTDPGRDSPPGSPKGTRPSRHLDVSPVESILDFYSSATGINMCFFKPLSLESL